jgi:hypothetical protein
MNLQRITKPFLVEIKNAKYERNDVTQFFVKKLSSIEYVQNQFFSMDIILFSLLNYEAN